jgi:hypothetical protein
MQDTYPDSASGLALMAYCASHPFSACCPVRPISPIHSGCGLIRAASGLSRWAKTKGRVGRVERTNRSMTNELDRGSVDLKIRTIQFVKPIGFIER